MADPLAPLATSIDQCSENIASASKKVNSGSIPGPIKSLNY